MARTQKTILIDTVTALHQQAGFHVARASSLLDLARSSYYRLDRHYRHYRPVEQPIPHTDRRNRRRCRRPSGGVIIDLLLADEDSDRSVVQLYWRSADEGLAACSDRTFYRVAR